MTSAKMFKFGLIEDAKAQRIGIYGGGGIGKTSLACGAPGPVAIFDFETSLPMLKANFEGKDIRPISGVETFTDVRDALHSNIYQGIKTIVIDSATRVQELIAEDVVKTMLTDKGQKVTQLSGFGYGKGFEHVFGKWLLFLQSLDIHHRAGRNVVLIMHECAEKCPNPDGVDYIRWEPRLQGMNNGNVKAATREWVDHLLFIKLDVAVSEEGKARGGYSRTIYPTESAVHVAKSRSLRDPIVYGEGETKLWDKLFPKGA